MEAITKFISKLVDIAVLKNTTFFPNKNGLLFEGEIKEKIQKFIKNKDDIDSFKKAFFPSNGFSFFSDKFINTVYEHVKKIYGQINIKKLSNHREKLYLVDNLGVIKYAIKNSNYGSNVPDYYKIDYPDDPITLDKFKFDVTGGDDNQNTMVGYGRLDEVKNDLRPGTFLFAKDKRTVGVYIGCNLVIYGAVHNELRSDEKIGNYVIVAKLRNFKAAANRMNAILNKVKSVCTSEQEKTEIGNKFKNIIEKDFFVYYARKSFVFNDFKDPEDNIELTQGDLKNIYAAIKNINVFDKFKKFIEIPGYNYVKERDNDKETRNMLMGIEEAVYEDTQINNRESGPGRGNSYFDELKKKVMSSSFGNDYISKNQLKELMELTVTDVTISGIKIPDFRLVHGLPFQFTPLVDPRPFEDSESKTRSDYGYFFANNYITKTPIIHILVGEPKYLPGVKDKDKDEIIASTLQGTQEAIETATGTKDIRYYGFKSADKQYYDYVNTMCQTHAIFAGIGGEVIDKKGPLAQYNFFQWNRRPTSNTEADSTSSYAADFYQGFVGEMFAYSPASSRDFNVNNSTGQSLIASKVKSMSPKVREFQYLLGGTSKNFTFLDNLSNEDQEELSARLKEIEGFGLFSANNTGIVGRVAKAISLVAMGGNLLLPDLWQDSSTSSTSIDLEIKLRSPYSDIISRFLYVMVPYYKLLGMAMPRSLTETSYTAPFILRCFSKGDFNIECGMIKRFSAKKYGDGSELANDMIPSAIDINITIEDLYDAIHMTKFVKWETFFNNSGFFNMLSVDAGFALYKEDIKKKIEMWTIMKTQQLNQQYGLIALNRLIQNRRLRGIFDFFKGINQ